MKQHYVPQVYLKNFACKVDKKEFFVYVFDKKLDKHKTINVKNICAEKHLYTLPESSKVAKDIYAIEKLYSDFIEPMYLRAYNILIDNNISAINEFQRTEILTGIFQLYIRNPRFITNTIKHHTNQINNLYDEAKRIKAKGFSYLDEDFSFKEWSKEQIIQYFIELTTKLFKEQHVVGIKEMISFHEEAIFEINIAKDNAQFITSDNPMTIEDIIAQNDFPLLRSKEFTIPLNKKFALRIFHDNKMNRNLIHRIFISNGNVHLMNVETFRQSSRFLIGDKEAFENYSQLQKTFNSTSTELKMDAVKQILETFKPTEETKAATKVLEKLYEKYLKEGITPNDEYEMMKKIEQLNIDKKKKRLQ